MNWNDYEAIWKRQEQPVGANADVMALKATFETKRRKLAAALFARDLLEAGTGVVVCFAFAFIWWQAGRAGWPMGLAILLVLGVSGVFIRERFRARRLRLGADATLLAKVEADIDELRHQRNLFLKMRRWYLGPIFAAVLMVNATLYLHARAWEPARDPWFNAGFIGFYLLLSWFAWVINRREVRRRLEPRLEELEKLRRDLLSSG